MSNCGDARGHPLPKHVIGRVPFRRPPLSGATGPRRFRPARGPGDVVGLKNLHANLNGTDT